ncbi:MAG: prepilin-type N-terminal cleavage/methylation domain-containing protein [Planctomycetales bacterium]|nr:prepilin-type N-terminal cleavage/methylation domain-containing protein [Planctomycetales bacterium]
MTGVRRGLSLLEVILALAILAISMAAIGELIRMGTRAARQAEDLTRAQILCESKLSEIVAGVQTADPVSRLGFPAEPGWYYSVDLAPTDDQGVMALTVLVETNIDAPRPTAFSLTRWIPDPGIELADSQGQSSTQGGAAQGATQ